MKVDVYYNIRRKDFSIRYRGKVIHHDDHVILRGATFKVSEPGRQRVLLSGHKNVHAYVRGEWNPEDATKVYFGKDVLRVAGKFRTAYYNPFKTDTFVDAETREPLHSSDIVGLLHGKIYYYIENHPA